MPKKTKQFLEREVEYIWDEFYVNGTGSKKKIQAIYDYLSKEYSYGFGEAILSGKLMRFPHEVRKYMNCLETGIFAYLLQLEMGFMPDFEVLGKAVYTIGTEESTSEYDHAVTVVPINGRKLFFDPAMGTIDFIEKEEGNGIILAGRKKEKTKITYESRDQYSLEELLDKMDYLQTTEGKVKTLTQEYRVKSMRILRGLAIQFTSVQYDKDNNIFKTIVKDIFNEFSNRQFIINDHLTKGGNIRNSTVDFYTAREKNFSDKKKFFFMDKKKLDKMYSKLKLNRKINNKNFSTSDVISDLINNRGLDELSAKLHVEREFLDELSTSLNKEMEDYFHENTFDDDFIRTCKLRELYEEACSVDEETLGKEVIDKHFGDSLNKAFASYRNCLHNYFVYRYKDAYNIRITRKRREKISSEMDKAEHRLSLINTMFAYKKTKNDFFYYVLGMDLFSDILGKIDPKKINDELGLEKHDGLLGYKQIVSASIAHYLSHKNIFDLKPYKKRLFPIIKEYLHMVK